MKASLGILTTHLSVCTSSVLRHHGHWVSEWVKSLSRVRLFVTPWTVAYQALPSMGFSRQEYWSGLPFPSPVDLPNPGMEPGSPALQTDALPSEPAGKPHYDANFQANRFSQLFSTLFLAPKTYLQTLLREWVIYHFSINALNHFFLQNHFVLFSRLCVCEAGSVVKNLPANVENIGDVGSVPGSRRSLGVGNSNQLQYSCLENSMDRGVWWATVHR